MSLINLNSRKDLFPNIEDFWSGSWFNDFRKDLVPAVNIHEGKDTYEFEVAVPGMDKEDLKIEIEDSVLHLSGEKKSEKEDKKDKKTTRREFSYQSFDRYFDLPVNINKDKLEAKYDKGILRINIAKMNEIKNSENKVINIQ